MQITYFIIPKPFVDKIANKGVDLIPIVGPAYKWSSQAKKITKLSNPVAATSRAIGIVIITCTGPIVKYPALCALWATTTVVGGLSANPVLLGASLEFAEIILEEVSGGD